LRLESKFVLEFSRSIYKYSNYTFRTFLDVPLYYSNIQISIHKARRGRIQTHLKFEIFRIEKVPEVHSPFEKGDLPPKKVNGRVNRVNHPSKGE